VKPIEAVRRAVRAREDQRCAVDERPARDARARQREDLRDDLPSATRERRRSSPAFVEDKGSDARGEARRSRRKRGKGSAAAARGRAPKIVVRLCRSLS
jgi:hypothetical protein